MVLELESLVMSLGEGTLLQKLPGNGREFGIRIVTAVFQTQLHFKSLETRDAAFAQISDKLSTPTKIRLDESIGLIKVESPTTRK